MTRAVCEPTRILDARHLQNAEEYYQSSASRLLLEMQASAQVPSNRNGPDYPPDYVTIIHPVNTHCDGRDPWAGRGTGNGNETH